jgi:hypothetical protein
MGGVIGFDTPAKQSNDKFIGDVTNAFHTRRDS